MNYTENQEQEQEILKNEAVKQFELNYLVMPRALYKLDLNATELKILCFIISYNSKEFYFTNEHLGEMFGITERSVSSAVNALKEKGFININYKIKAGGGKIRFISKTKQLEEIFLSDRKKSSCRTGRNLPDKDNKIKDNKIKDIMSDNQKLMDYWIKLEHPDLYNNATKEQKEALYKRFAKDYSNIMEMAGSIEIAKQAVTACRDWLKSKNLEYNLTTIARNLPKFLNHTIKDIILPPELDVALFNEYCDLLEKYSGKITDKKKIISIIKLRIKQGININKHLTDKISEIKEKINREALSKFPNELQEKIKEIANNKTY